METVIANARLPELQGRGKRRHVAKFYVASILGVFSLSAAVLADPIKLTGSRHEDYRGTPRLEFPETSASQAKSAGEYLRAQWARFKIPSDLSNLEVVNVRQSLIGIHTRYRQMLNGVPVEGAEIIVSQRKTDSSIYQVYNNTYPVETPVPLTKDNVSKDTALQKAWDHLRVFGSLKSIPKVDLIYVPDKTGFRLVYKTLIIVSGPFGYWEHKIDAQSGEVISVRRHEINEKYAADVVPDFSAYQGPTTSLQTELVRLEAAVHSSPKTSGVSTKTTVDGTALVFDPDPRTTLANDALVDSSPAASFNAAYFTRPLRQITLDAGVYSLQGPWVSIVSLAFELPAIAVSTTEDGNWTVKRGNNAFNDVMCYFHIDQNQRYLQSLGYTGATGLQEGSISVDSDGVDGDDNSWYVPAENYIVFGHGGVDDDEDADVILHEYGHAITQDATPGWGGGDSGAIGEGFGDYWGASYSWTCPNGATYHPAWVFSWDGHSADTWAGRFLDKTKFTYDYSHMYVEHETINGIVEYSDQLWGTPIYQAFRDLIGLGRPRTEMDSIIIESFFGVGYGVKMRDMANATVKAAMELYPAGNHATVYYARFTNQLILVSYPLPDPTLLYPIGGELLTAGTTINIQWNRNGATSQAATRIEYSSQITGEGAYFNDQVENGTNGWIPSKKGGSDWYVTASDSHSPTRSWFAADDTGTGDQFLTRSSISVSNGAVLSFWHSYDLESAYDGAVVEISTNGTTWTDLGTNATQNGYNATISASYGSSIGGRKAFSGSSRGFVETRIPLAGYAGKTVQLRFREADDSSDASVGWWVDDIQISVEALWSAVVTTPTNTSSYSWTLPVTPGTNYGVRLKLIGSNCTDSSWATSSAFTLVAGANGTPTNISLSNATVPENQPAGTTVGAFNTQDPDVGNTFVYALSNGTGDTDNGSFTISGGNLVTAAVLDYEAKTTCSIRVRSTDQGGLWFEKVCMITVGNLNDFYKLTVLSPYGGSAPSGTNSYHLSTAVSAVVTNSPFQNGTTQYVCSGWAGTGSVPPVGNMTNTASFSMTSDSTLVWLWTTNFWLDTATGGNGSVNVNDGWWPKGSNAQITAVSDGHYHFSIWSGATNGCLLSGNMLTVPMTRARSIMAIFAVDQCRLVVSTPYGAGLPPKGTNSCNYGSTVIASITNAPVTLSGSTQYVCKGWTGSGSVPAFGVTPNTGPFVITNESSIAWQWSTNYWMKGATNGNGTVSVNNGWYPSGTNVIVTATPGYGWRFNGWSGQTNGCEVSDATIWVLMDRARTNITANFVRQYRLIVATPYGGGMPPLGTNWFDTGASVKAAISNSPVINGTTQYVCRGWAGTGKVPTSGIPTNTAAFSMTTDSTITWLWRTNYWLDVSCTGQGRLSTNDCWVAKGSNLLITATASNFWYFGNWTGTTNGCTITSNKIAVVMSGPRQVTAVLKPYLATNNVPKWWLYQYGLTNFNGNAMQDFDLDGMLTWEEWVAGTDPTNSASSFKFTFIGGDQAGDRILRWPSIPNRFYSLSRSTNLLAGGGGFILVPAASNMLATPPENVYIDGVNGLSPVFYRIHVRE